jgi:ferric-dicitrate binding protein FerR (iron transport regulator)
LITMDYDLLKILSHSNKDIDNQKLMDYIAGKLSAEDKHEIEKWMADSNFMNDAVEGLQTVKNKANLSTLVEQLNQDLQKRLEQKKNRKNKRRLKDYAWIYYAIVFVLFVILITWYIIQRMHSSH